MHEHTPASLIYLADTEITPVSYYTEGNDLAERIGNYSSFDVRIQNARLVSDDPNLDREGFILTESVSRITDYYDHDQICERYYREIGDLVKRVTGATRVLVFDHTIRVERDGDNNIGERAPVRLVHNDYTVQSGPQRVHDLVEPQMVQAWLDARFAEFNIWRPIRGPIHSVPLALCDARSVAPENLIVVDLVYPERTGEIYHAVYSRNHRWFYFPDMTTDEVLIFKCYDSSTDGRARFTLHTAFDVPNSPPNAEARESIEVRVLASFGN